MIGVAGKPPTARLASTSATAGGRGRHHPRRRRKRRHGLMLEHRTRRDQKPGPPRPADQLDRHDAVAAQLEEVVVDADPRSAPAPRQTARTASPPAASAAHDAAAPSSAPAQAAHGGRACRSPSAAAAPAPPAPTAPCSPADCRDSAAPQRREVDNRARRRNHVADQPLARPRRRPRHHRGLRHAAIPAQRRLDLARLDAEPAQLHLRVGAPQKLQHPVARHRARSPVRYIRLPEAPCTQPCGSATNRSAVSPARFR